MTPDVSRSAAPVHHHHSQAAHLPDLAQQLLAAIETEIVITDENKKALDAPALTQFREQLRRLVVNAAATNSNVISNGFYAGQLQSGTDSLEKFIQEISARVAERVAKQGVEGRMFTADEFIAFSAGVLTTERMDDDIIAVFQGVMLHQDGERQKFRDELKALTAELKIFGVIQSRISKNMAEKTAIDLVALDQCNLFDHSLYGYETKEKFQDSAEFKLLKSLLNPAKENEQQKTEVLKGEIAPLNLSIKQFLERGPKASGVMPNVQERYEWAKENNPLAAFSSAIGDLSRPINDKVSEVTTRLNDITTRYNSAVEALSRFIQKYNDIFQNILRAI